MADKSSSVTIKYGAGFEASWYVVSGTPEEIRAQLIEYFKLAEAEELSVHEVVLQATQVAQASFAVANGLNASPQGAGNNRRGGQQRRSSTNSQPSDSPKDSGEKKDEHPYGEVLAAIEGATSKQDIGRLWALHKEAFKHPDVEAASKAKAASFTA